MARVRFPVALCALSSIALVAVFGVLLEAIEARTQAQGSAVAPAAGSGLLLGQTVEAASGAPIAGVSVHLRSQSWPAHDDSVTSNQLGQFVFRDLPAGFFELEVWKDGWFPGDGAARSWVPARLQLADGQRIGSFKLALSRNAVISGRVIDENNRPAAGVGVVALGRDREGGSRWINSRSTQTDDRGIFRFEVPPGEYLLSAPVDGRTQRIERQDVASGKTLVFERVFFPGAATAAEAVPVAVGPGQERTDVDLRLKLAQAFRLSGHVEREGAEGPADLVLVREHGSEFLPEFEQKYGLSDATGRFSFTGVPAGDYTLRAAVYPFHGTAMPPAAYWTELRMIITDADVTDVRVQLRGAPRISGHVEFRGATPPVADLAKAEIRASDRDGRGPKTNIAADGRFVLPGTQPGRYTLRASVPGWNVLSATAGGRDLGDRLFDLAADLTDVTITVTDRMTSVSGRVTGAAGMADAGAAVIAFPTDASRWTDLGFNVRRIRVVRTNRDGSYAFPSLPPGEYFVAAVREDPGSRWWIQWMTVYGEESPRPDQEPGDWRNPDFLKAVAAGAQRVSLAEGATVVVPLQTRFIK